MTLHEIHQNRNKLLIKTSHNKNSWSETARYSNQKIPTFSYKNTIKHEKYAETRKGKFKNWAGEVSMKTSPERSQKEEIPQKFPN